MKMEGAWTLTVDDAGLPEGWSWSDHTPGGLEGVLIESGTYWSPVIHISAPESATGDAEGHLALSLTLDSDTQVEISSILPVEANRTRGLSVLGPEGLPMSQGFGFSGGSAVAWILVEIWVMQLKIRYCSLGHPQNGATISDYKTPRQRKR